MERVTRRLERAYTFGMSKELLGMTTNGALVYLEPDTSHAVTHFAHQSKLRAAVEKVIPTLDGGPDWIRIEHDTGDVVGTTDLVATTDGDDIVYAKRPRRQTYSRFVKGKQSLPTSWITIALRKTEEHEYKLYTAFVGRSTPSFPGGDYLPEQSKEFWSKHALVWGSQEVIPGSETKECPW